MRNKQKQAVVQLLKSKGTSLREVAGELGTHRFYPGRVLDCFFLEGLPCDRGKALLVKQTIANKIGEPLEKFLPTI